MQGIYNIWYGALRSSDRLDLFASAGGIPPAEVPPSDFIARIRDELGTLTRVREAAALPWNDLTAAILAELRFNSIAGWLPQGEASELRGAFRPNEPPLSDCRTGRRREC